MPAGPPVWVSVAVILLVVSSAQVPGRIEEARLPRAVFWAEVMCPRSRTSVKASVKRIMDNRYDANGVVFI
jgi:hypothetical protein